MNMKIVVAGMAALLMAGSEAAAQSSVCRATVTKNAVVKSTERQRTWNVTFDVVAPGCDNSRGRFSYAIQLDASGKRSSETETLDFTTAGGLRSTVKASYRARSGQEVKDISGITVQECACTQAGR